MRWWAVEEEVKKSQESEWGWASYPVEAGKELRELLLVLRLGLHLVDVLRHRCHRSAHLRTHTYAPTVTTIATSRAAAAAAHAWIWSVDRAGAEKGGL
jgi:hypothetical protein